MPLHLFCWPDIVCFCADRRCGTGMRDMQTGTILDGKYKILREIGRGGMSVVYLAVNEKANKLWAVKEVRRETGCAAEIVRARLAAETELLKKLRHPQLPDIVDVIDREDTFLIVMDYIEGIPLDKLLKERGYIAEEEALSWAKQLCGVLGYLHRQDPPVIYRDMKPSNIILRPDGTVVLIDFGTAREIRYEGEQEDTVCLGTPGYAAPEQWGGCGQTDARTDIYCLGAALYHLLTGRSPCEPPYTMRPIRVWDPKLSPELEAVILKCTRRDPLRRYQSCQELLRALERCEEARALCRRKREQKKGSCVKAALCLLLLGGGIYGALLLFGVRPEVFLDAAEKWRDRILTGKTAVRVVPLLLVVRIPAILDRLCGELSGRRRRGQEKKRREDGL